MSYNARLKRIEVMVEKLPTHLSDEATMKGPPLRQMVADLRWLVDECRRLQDRVK